MMDIPAPFRLAEVTVSPQWTDYNAHLSEWAYLLMFGDSADAFFRFFGWTTPTGRRASRCSRSRPTCGTCARRARASG